jgi:secondary thiamine-phosphate synthase enzyme
MKTHSTTFHVATRGFTDVHDITSRVEQCVAQSGVSEGLMVVFVPGSTAGITTIEFESGAVSDLKAAIERLAPQKMHYDHDARWGDGNGFAHVRAALLGPSLSLPLVDGSPGLGTWQQIVLVDFDNRSRDRAVTVQIIGTD